MGAIIERKKIENSKIEKNIERIIIKNNKENKKLKA